MGSWKRRDDADYERVERGFAMTDYKHVILCYATLYACSAAMSIVCGCKTHDDRSGSLLCDKNIGEYYSIREWQDCRVVMNLNECIQDYDELSRGEVVPGARKSAEGLK